MVLLFYVKWFFILLFWCDCLIDIIGIDVGRLVRSFFVKVMVEKFVFDWVLEDFWFVDFGIWMFLFGRRFCDRFFFCLSYSVVGGFFVLVFLFLFVW